MAAILLFAILFGESLAAGSPLPDLPGGGSLEKWEQPWRQMTDSGEKRITDYPYYPETEEKALTVYNQVPKIGDGEWMVLRNAYQTVRVAVDGETVFQYEGGFVGSRRPITGSFLCMVPLKAEYSGKTISVELTSPDRAALQVASPIRMGTAAEIRFTVFQSNRGVLLFSVAMVILMLISFGIYLFSRRYENRRDYQNFLFLGIFILLAMIWVLTDSTLGFLLSVNPAFIFLVSMVCFQLLPVPFLPVVWQNCGWDSRTLRLLQRLFWANCAAQGLLYFFDVFSYPRMLPVTHILLVLTIFYLLWRLVKDVKEKASASAKNLLGIVGIFSVFGLASLFIFSLGMRKDNSKLFRWGLLIFVVLLLGETWSKLIRLVQERIQMEVYKKMAYQDVLTGLGNRTAFEERIEELEESLAAGSLVSLAMLDLNGLKQVNDTGRHRAGDQLLRDIAGCLRRAFEGMGECYRIGGDEFAVLFPGTEMTNDTCRTMVHRELARFHEETGRELSISGGCVSSRVEEKGKFRISGMMEQADALMYEEKRMFHGSRDGEGK